MNTRESLETLLDQGKLGFKVQRGKVWRVRRNGKTQTWKTRPTDFRIPVKIGYREYHEITHLNMNCQPWMEMKDG